MMRVISGNCKGRKLKAVPGSTTRPTTDKVKESLFNMIGPYFDGGLGLDLFAGSGSLGIEALSRGLHKVIFVDRNIKACQTVKENIQSCQLDKRYELFRNDAKRALQAIIKRGLTFNIIFLDPPYKQQHLTAFLELIDKENLVVDNGFVICEYGIETVLPKNVGNLRKVKNLSYGIIGLAIYANMCNDVKGE